MRQKNDNLKYTYTFLQRNMNKIKFKYLTFFSIAFIYTTFSHAQKSTNASGGDAAGILGSVAYSVGQIDCSNNISTAGTVNIGVQQPYEIFTIGIIESEFNSALLVFPNPTVDNLTLIIDDYNNEELLYQLFDIKGELLIKDRVNTQQTQINTLCLAPSTYHLYIINQSNNKVQSFKIIKN